MYNLEMFKSTMNTNSSITIMIKETISRYCNNMGLGFSYNVHELS